MATFFSLHEVMLPVPCTLRQIDGKQVLFRVYAVVSYDILRFYLKRYYYAEQSIFFFFTEVAYCHRGEIGCDRSQHKHQ